MTNSFIINTPIPDKDSGHGQEVSDGTVTHYHLPKQQLVELGFTSPEDGQYVPPGGPCFAIDCGGAYRDPNTQYTSLDGGGAVQNCP